MGCSMYMYWPGRFVMPHACLVRTTFTHVHFTSVTQLKAR